MTPAPLPQLAVIVPVRNRPGEIRRCLEGVRASAGQHLIELIVVDNGSTDDTAAVAAACGVHVVSEPVPNRCNARNRGAREAAAPWLAFLDSDCVPNPQWIPALLAAIALLPPESPTTLIAGPVLAAPPATTVEAYITERRWIDQEKFLTPGRRFSPPFAATANLAVRRDVYLALGGLDPALAIAGEDADFCWRAAQAGWTIQYEPRATVIHYHRATLRGLWRQAFHYGLGNADLFAKWHHSWHANSWIEPCHAVWALKGLAKAPFRWLSGRTPLARREPVYDFLANLAMLLGRARGGLRHRLPIL